MLNYMVRCPHCGKAIVIGQEATTVQCPYCGGAFDAKEERSVLIEEKKALMKSQIRSMINEKRYEEARSLAIDSASVMEGKAAFYALILECDLLRQHLFYFDSKAIGVGVSALVGSSDYEKFAESDGLQWQKAVLQAMTSFFKKVKTHLERHKSFVGERYDAISRLAYVGRCCLLLSKAGVKTDGLAKECVSLIEEVCAGDKGDAYNMPKDLFETARSICEELSETFRFASSIKLQLNPNKKGKVVPKAKMVCPVCGAELPPLSKGQFVSCPSCRHRVSRDKALEAASVSDPVSYQEKLFVALENNDLPFACEMVEVLTKKEPDNPDYALAGLVVAMNEITPLRLFVDDYVGLLEKALLGKPNGLDQRMKESAAHFANIDEILSEYLGVPHGPSPALIDVLRRFVARLEKAR